MRTAIAIIMVIVGLFLMFVTFFFLGAPLGPPIAEVYADPRVPFSPALFILGVMLIFLAGVVYELLPERTGD